MTTLFGTATMVALRNAIAGTDRYKFTQLSWGKIAVQFALWVGENLTSSRHIHD